MEAERAIFRGEELQGLHHLDEYAHWRVAPGSFVLDLWTRGANLGRGGGRNLGRGGGGGGEPGEWGEPGEGGGVLL